MNPKRSRVDQLVGLGAGTQQPEPWNRLEDAAAAPPDLREKFPDSTSRASHVRSAEEAEGSRLTMAHTCRRGEDTRDQA